MIKIAAFTVIALGVAGCVSPQQQALNDARDCQAMGAKPGTDIYVQCQLYKQKIRSDREASDSDALLAYGSQMLAGPRRLETTCTSNRIGFQTVTNCY